MYSKICSLYLAHPVLRSSRQPWCNLQGPDPDLQSVHMVKGTKWISTYYMFAMIVVGGNGTPGGNPHRHREKLNTERPTPLGN